jgi:hypothetical protein
MKNLKRIAAIVGLSLLIVAAVSALPAETRTQPANASQQPFDHSNCQYPTRTTNPPDGCDNSDPANPYCAVKGLPEDCQEPQPVQPTPTPTETPAPAKAECSGK